MDPSSVRPLHTTNLSGMGQLLLENERALRKLHRVRQRRDHYARLYFQTLSELEETRWKLAGAVNTIRDLKAQGHARQKVFHSNTTSPDSGTSLSPGIDHVEYSARRDGHTHKDGRYHPSRPQHYHRQEPNRGAWPPNRGAWHSDSEGGGGGGPKWPARDASQHPQQSSHFSFHQLSTSHTPHQPGHTPYQDGHIPHQTGHTPRPQASHAPPQQSPNYYPSAFSPTRPIGRLLASIPQQQQLQSASQQTPAPLTPASLTPRTPRTPRTPQTAATPHSFTLPPAAETTPFYAHSHAHAPRQPVLLRSHTLPAPGGGSGRSGCGHGSQEQHMETRLPSSFSEDDLLDLERPTYSAFRTPASQPLPLHTSPSPNQLHAVASNDSDAPMLEAGGKDSSEGVASSEEQRAPPRVESGTCCCYDNLSSVDMLDLLLDISSPQCTIQILQVERSHLGEPEAMKLFCSSLARNRSITELSLPENDICGESLGLLLETIKVGTSIKDLKLRKNLIGQECAAIIKQFLAETKLDSLVLTGNQIEQFGHLLDDGQIQSEFSMEYSSDDSGVHTGTAPPFNAQPTPQINTSFKYLHI